MSERLLTDEELCPNIAETEALRKQDAKTASIKDAEIRKLAKLAGDYLNTGICDICYEDDCGGENSCTKGKYGESCKCHTRISEARAKLEQALEAKYTKEGG